MPDPITPETKDWTWVLTRPCPDCGLDAGALPAEQLAARARATAGTWRDRLAQPDAATRPAPGTWSPLEYGAHVRDVMALARTRLTALLEQDDPVFADWDQDATAVADRYGEQDPAVVAGEVERAAEALAGLLDAVPAGAWERPGRRSNGSVFTVASLGRYVVHDLVHHEEDVRPGAAAR